MVKSLFQVFLLFLFIGSLLLRSQRGISSRQTLLVWALLACFGFWGHLNFFTFHGGGTHVHNLEMYHYYMGSKYFPETGYTKLYEASLIADAEDDPNFHPELSVRSLENYELVTRKSVLDRKSEILASFTAPRWQKFREDMAVFRNTAPTNWGTKFGYQDHGYNGTPLVTTVLSFISSQPWLKTDVFMRGAAWFDLVLILVTSLIIAWLLNTEAALAFLFFLALNPLNDYSMIGGAYFRYEYFLSLALAVACIRRGFFSASGVLLAVSTFFRIFPLCCAAVLLLYWVVNRKCQDRVRGLARFFTAFFIAALLLFCITSIKKGPEGENPWKSFEKQISLHRGQPNVNKIGLKYLFSFSDEHNTREVLKTWPNGKRLNWAVEFLKTYEHRKIFHEAASVFFALLLILFLRSVSPVEALAGGFVLIFCALSLSHYYYCFLSLIPLLFFENRKVMAGTAVVFAGMISLPLISAIGSIPDRRFFTLSGMILVLFVWLFLTRTMKPPHSPREILENVNG